MPRVICDLPNAADEISGVKFHPLEDGGRISDEMSQEMAERFASIPGYSLDDGESAPPEPVKPPPAPTTRKAAVKKAAAETKQPEPVVETQPPAGEVDGAAATGAAGAGDNGAGDNEEVF